MRELYLSEEESTEQFFVLYDDDGVRYQLARTQLPQLTTPEPEADAEADDAAAVEVAPEPAATTDESAAADAERSLPEPDPLYATALSMRPSEMQSRIRAGATVAELAQEMGVAESRVEPYAHPVLLERSQIAEAAKQSHPIRDGGPAKLTLFEILASAFAARGHSLVDATWDATREPGDTWVVHVRWQAGLTDNEATWSFKRQMGAGATTEARDAVAADLTDPDFVQPVRSLTAVDSADAHDEAEEPEAIEGDFLQHPDEAEQPQRRRRKAVTPHWEDVLLGVRTTQKRPKS